MPLILHRSKDKKQDGDRPPAANVNDQGVPPSEPDKANENRNQGNEDPQKILQIDDPNAVHIDGK